MSVIIAIANRKGGVGKSTISTMIAHSLAVWGRQRVLVIDLDSQANTSLILMGGSNWAQARIEERTAAEFLFDQFSRDHGDADRFIVRRAGDVLGADNQPTELALIPGSLEMENCERDQLHHLSGANADLARIGEIIKGGVIRKLEQAASQFDALIVDCPPGISYATEAALAVADKVIVPFRPDYVSLFAVDRIARMIEDAPNPRALQEIPKNKRRYAALANLCQAKPSHQRLIEDISAFHPVLQTRIPQSGAIANAFDWERERKSIDRKYGSAVSIVRGLYDEVAPMLQEAERNKGVTVEWAQTRQYARPIA